MSYSRRSFMGLACLAIGGCGVSTQELSNPRELSLDELANRVNGMRDVNQVERVFAGVVVSVHDNAVYVYRRVPATVFDNELNALDDSRIFLRSAPYSNDQLRQLSAVIESDRARWVAEGVTLSSLAVSPRGDAVLVGVQPSSAVPLVQVRYKGKPVVVKATTITTF
jgi:hypothetical protein